MRVDSRAPIFGEHLAEIAHQAPLWHARDASARANSQRNLCTNEALIADAVAIYVAVPARVRATHAAVHVVGELICRDGANMNAMLGCRPPRRNTKCNPGDLAKRLIDNGIHPPTIYFPLSVPA